MIASANGNLKICEFLLDNGAAIDMKDKVCAILRCTVAVIIHITKKYREAVQHYLLLVETVIYMFAIFFSLEEPTWMLKTRYEILVLIQYKFSV